ncbi:MAG TPA: ABC transporter permease [Candidatus Dormibacteraeota bacterium]|nr:ABC transporter permease [Candidatus Dormibacteraeota bacterium]
MRRPRWTSELLLVPALAWLGVFFVYPIGGLFYASLFTPAFSLASYAKLVATPIYLKVFVNTFEISVTVTLVTLVLGYPLAFLLATAGRRASRLMLVAIILPLWTSVLVRTYAWMVLLGRRGLVNEGLQGLGLTDAPLPLLYNRLGVTIGMVHVLLPFMVLPIYSVMKGIDVNLLKAAQNLGANRRQAFLRVYLPLSLSGLATGGLVVFVTALGFFVNPALLGGRGDMMIAMLIDSQVSQLLDWGLASALAVVLLAVTAAILLTVQRLTGGERLWVGVP